MKTTRNEDRSYLVKGHGQSELAAIGRGYDRGGLSRKGAWSAAQEFMARTVHGETTPRYHTVQVFRAGKLVWVAYRCADGTYTQIKAD